MRLCIKLSDDMANKVDAFAKSFGMSKSAFMSYCIGSHIRSLESQEDVIKGLKQAISASVPNNSQE